MGKPWYKVLWSFRRTLIIVLTPLLLMPIPFFYTTKAGKCAYSISIMAVYWMTEAIPIAATALLPILLFPWLGVQDSKSLCKNYLMDTNFLFFSGLLIALGVERWNLHKRIALKVLTIVGCKPQWLMFGFMLTTAFLSMWLSNTATAAMLMPIAHAVIAEMKRNRRMSVAEELSEMMASKKSFTGTGADTKETAIENGDLDLYDENEKVFFDNDSIASEIVEKKRPSIDVTAMKKRKKHPSLSSKAEREFKAISTGMKLSIAVAANIGGTATLTGTGPNIVFKGQADNLYGTETGLNFSSWFIFAFPNMVISLLFSWLWMALYFLGIRKTFSCRRQNTPQEDRANRIILNEYRKLGTISFAEVMMAVMFTILAVLWFTREPGFMPGWGSLPFLEKGFITDACTGMTIALLLFFLPSRPPYFLCCLFKRYGEEGPQPSEALLDWDTVNKKMAWSVIMLLGGSFALADASKNSGLSDDLGGIFNDFNALDPWILSLLLCLVTGILTNVTSNTATATIFLPVVGTLAVKIGVHPYYLMIPVCVTTSLAFLLPVATPPNAIAFAYGDLTILDMFKSGAVINIVTILILQLSINTYGYKIFNLGEMPDWALSGTPEQTLLSANGTDLFNATTEGLVNYTTV